MNDNLYLLSLQGPDGDLHRIDSWVISKEMYEHLRGHMPTETDLTTHHPRGEE